MGGPRVIVTQALADHLECRRRTPDKLALPIGVTTIKRVRQLLGHNHYIDNAAWWDARIGDLIRLTAAEFGGLHGVKEHTAAVARLRLLGRTLRPADWWRPPEVVDTLTSDAPTAEVADALGISALTARRLRLRALAKAEGFFIA